MSIGGNEWERGVREVRAQLLLIFGERIAGDIVRVSAGGNQQI
jgi:hypothetical protein